ncbi:hypothetical protein XENOCAPTIV_018839, partial [Xenoophorus captivus]
SFASDDCPMQNVNFHELETYFDTDKPCKSSQIVAVTQPSPVHVYVCLCRTPTERCFIRVEAL